MLQHFDSSFHPRSSRPPRSPRTPRMPRSSRSYVAAVCAAAVFAAAALLAAVSAACAADTMSGAAGVARYFMPDAAASKIVTVMSGATRRRQRRHTHRGGRSEGDRTQADHRALRRSLRVLTQLHRGPSRRADADNAMEPAARRRARFHDRGSSRSRADASAARAALEDHRTSIRSITRVCSISDAPCISRR